jgi:hypothetical protein
MTDDQNLTRPHPPTGQELDRQYDLLHEEHDGDEPATPEGQRHVREQEIDDYTEDLKDPD